MKAAIKKYLPILFYVLIIVFLIIYLSSIDFSKFKGIRFAWVYMLIASILGLVTRYWAVLTWLVILKSLGAEHFRRHLSKLVYVFAKSWMGRYIPGTAPWILGKIYFASKLGISREKLAVSSLLEGGMQIAVTLAVGFGLVLFSNHLNLIGPGLKLTTLIALAACIAAISPPVFNRLITLAYKLMRKKQLAKEHLAKRKTIVNGSLVYLAGAVVSGLAFFFVAKSVFPSLGYDNLLFVIGAANISGAIGMLAIFVPSGIGVRDGIFLAMLSVIMPTEIALVITVVSRLWGVVMDLVFLGFSKATELILPSEMPANEERS